MSSKFCDRFKELRLCNDLKQEELVKDFNSKYHFNFTRAAISQYENDKRIPEIEALQAFADYFNVSVDYLLGRTDIKNPKEEPKKLKPEVETIAAHLDDKELTPKKVKMIQDYIDLLFDEEF